MILVFGMEGGGFRHGGYRRSGNKCVEYDVRHV